MGKTANQIEDDIENKREDLGSNLQELEQKVKSVTDWRQHFENNPMTLIGAAFGGGILLATMMGGRKRYRQGRVFSSEPHMVTDTPHAGTDRQKQKALDTWDSIKGALIGVAATQFKGFIGELVPGFHEHFDKTENEKNRLDAA